MKILLPISILAAAPTMASAANDTQCDAKPFSFNKPKATAPPKASAEAPKAKPPAPKPAPKTSTSQAKPKPLADCKQPKKG